MKTQNIMGFLVLNFIGNIKPVIRKAWSKKEEKRKKYYNLSMLDSNCVGLTCNAKYVTYVFSLRLIPFTETVVIQF